MSRASGASAIAVVDSSELTAPAGHYSHAAIHDSLVFLSGQLPITAAGEAIASRPFDEQARQVLANLDSCLLAAGSARHRLLSVTVFITDMSEWPIFDDIYGSWLGSHRPARVVAQVARLHHGCAVELQAVAVAGRDVHPIRATEE